MRHNRYLCIKSPPQYLHKGNVVSVNLLLRNLEYVEKNTKTYLRKKKSKELVGRAQDAIFCHKSAVSTAEEMLGKEVNLH